MKIYDCSLIETKGCNMVFCSLCESEISTSLASPTIPTSTNVSYMNEYMIKVEVGSFIVVFSTPGSHSNANWEIFPAEVHQP